MPKDYVLGTDREELARLEIQHSIWTNISHASWLRANIGPGSKVLDLGAGPGFTSLELARLVGPSGQVVAFDQATNYLNFLKDSVKKNGIENLKITSGDIQANKINLPKNSFDAVYCRWVLAWLPNPTLALKHIKNILKPGGRIIVHDYFNWRAMCLAPRSTAIEKLVVAAIKSFEEKNCNIDIMADLPRLLKQQGFRENHFELFQRAARGGGKDSTIHWPITWWKIYGKKLVEQKKFSPKDMRAVEADLHTLAINEDYFFYCPPVFEIIATKT